MENQSELRSYLFYLLSNVPRVDYDPRINVVPQMPDVEFNRVLKTALLFTYSNSEIAKSLASCIILQDIHYYYISTNFLNKESK